jgi:ribosomal protein S25
MARARINVEKLARTLLLSGKVYVTVYELAALLGISTRVAGRLLAEMERRGIAVRQSKRAYKLVIQALA